MTKLNGPRGKLFRCYLLPILGCRLSCLVKFSKTRLISLNLDRFSKLGIGPKYEPIRKLHKSTTSKTSLANSIAQNKQKFSIWLWKIRQSVKIFQSYHSNGWKFLNYESMVILYIGTTSWIDWINGIYQIGWSSQLNLEDGTTNFEQFKKISQR